MNIQISFKKSFNCSYRDVALIIWNNMILAQELEFLYETKSLGNVIIKPKEITVDYIISVVCKYYNVPFNMLQMDTRKREIVLARQVCMYFSKELTKNTFNDIGRKLANRDGHTAMHGHKTVGELIQTDKTFKKQIEALEDMLK